MRNVQNDTNKINQGIKIFSWRFQQQQAGGSYNCCANFRSTAFLVESVARSILIIESSKYKKKYKNILDQLNRSYFFVQNG